jgi:AraC-like DNA-binding protein
VKKENHFQFTCPPQQNNVTVLQAMMRDFSYGKHAHEEYSLGVTLKGRQDFFCRNAFHKSPAGGVLVFNPEDVHDGHSGVQQDLEYVMLYIHPDEFNPLFDALSCRQNNPVRLANNLLDDPILRYQILAMSQLVQQSGYSTIELESGLFQLAQSLVKHCKALSQERATSRVDSLLLRAKDYALAHIAEDISIDDIATAASMSKFHFIRLFRQQFGITPHQYVLNCRINSARKALDRGLPATQVAQEFGFSDSSHLNRRFKSAFGMTPKQYQLQRT